MDDGGARRKPNAAASAKTRALAAAASCRGRRLGEAETAPRVAPTPSLGLSARPGFPPKPKPVASRRVEVESSKTPKTPKTPPKTPPLRSVGEYRRMLNTESEREQRIAAERFPRAQDAFVARGEYRGGETRAVARSAASRVRDAGEREREREDAAAAAAAAKDVGGGETRHRRRQASVSDQD